MVYDPRLDGTPGEHANDDMHHIESGNAALVMADFARRANQPMDWAAIAELANICDEPVTT